MKKNKPTLILLLYILCLLDLFSIQISLTFIQLQTFDNDFENKAPTGCTQYYYGETSQGFKTFNYANGVHLANQNQRICFRYIISMNNCFQKNHIKSTIQI